MMTLKKLLIIIIIILNSVAGCTSIQEETPNVDEIKVSTQRIIIEENSLWELSQQSISPISNTKKAADYIMAGEYLNQNFSIPIDWQFSTIKGRGFPYNMHAFIPVMELVAEYNKSGKEEYIDKAFEITFDWITQNDGEVDTDNWAWHDDATARRTYIMSVLYKFSGDRLNQQQKDILKHSLDYQAEILSKDFFYKARHNHGMYQDQALAMYALVMNDENSTSYLNLAKERVSEYFEYVVANDGVHKEHSPRYHCDIAMSISWFAKAYEKYDPAFSKQMTDLFILMGEYATWIIMPDGTLPSVGDSPRRKFEYNGWNENPEHLYVLSQGKDGNQPNSTMKVFPDSGYGIMRSGWEDSDVWILFTAATHSGAHKHNDDLNFLIYSDGGLVFTEGGKRNYNYTEELTQYAYSSYAHNVLLVNEDGWKMRDTGLPLLENSAYNTRIIGYDENAKTRWIKGVQTRFEGVEQKRTIFYNAEREFIQVKDDISVQQDNNIKLIYHIADDIEVKEQVDGWILLRNEKEIMKVKPKGSGEIRIQTITQEVLPYQTLIFEGEAEPRYGTTLVIEMTCLQKQKNWVELNLFLDSQIDEAEINITELTEIQSTATTCNEIAPFMEAVDVEVIVKGDSILCENNYDGENLEYAWYIYQDSLESTPIEKISYSTNKKLNYVTKEPGTYFVKAFIKDRNEKKQSVTTREISVK